MHFYALIPIATILVSAAFAAVSIAWNSERRQTASMTTVFALTGLWGLLNALIDLAGAPEQALFWMRFLHLPPLLLGPCVPLLLAQMLPQVGPRMRQLARLGFVLGAVAGLASALLPGSLEGVVATDWGGWMPRYGVVSIVLVPLGCVLPVLAAIEASRVEVRPAAARVESSRKRAVLTVVSLSLLAALTTEYAMPLLGIPAPRLGATGVACAAAVMWLRVLHVADDLAITPHGLARAMLAELRDGVALVDLEGVVLSSNARLDEMIGQSGRDLRGRTITECVDAPFDAIRHGMEDRESVLRGVDGTTRPVSLSSSTARDRFGRAAGYVVAVRDLREIDVLRARLFTSGRLAAIGELAAGIAHEVNNPIAFVRSDLNLLSERLDELHRRVRREDSLTDELAVLERDQHRIASALESIGRVAQVVEDVQGFAHVGEARQGRSDPASLVEGAMRLAGLRRGGDVDVRVSTIHCDERVDHGQELKQVLLALLQVLIDDSEKGGRIDIEIDSDPDRLRLRLAADRLVAGAEAVLDRFERATSRRGGEATRDFGLAIATEIVDGLGGSLRFEAPESDAIVCELHLPHEEEVGA